MEPGYAHKARVFIGKLIQMQRTIEQEGYLRTDLQAIHQSASYLKRYLDYYRYNNDEQMRGFFNRNIERIRILLPRKTHQAYEALMEEFLGLKD